MQARTAGRELAFILLTQSDKNPTKTDFSNMILSSVRTLESNAKDELQLVMNSLMEYKAQIADYEANHEKNLNRPLDAENISVPVLMTAELNEKIEQLINVAEKAFTALEIAEFTTLDSSDEVKKFALELVKTCKNHEKDLNEQIKKYAINWDVERLVSMDKNILKIALAELLIIKENPVKVVVDEAVELAKKYSTDDSSNFINGILAKVIVDNGLN